MKCQDLQLNLPLYFDDVLSADEISALNAHLVQCPLCRQKLSDLHEVRNSLRGLVRPAMPADALNSIRAVISAEIAAKSSSVPGIAVLEPRRNWIDVWLMPYAVGACATLILGFTLLWIMLSAAYRLPQDFASGSASRSNSTVLLTNIEPNTIDLTPTEYASSRLAIAGESPSINPRGTLVALTRSLVGNEMRDDEVVVVADVFGNGLAEIAEVVEPSHDREAVVELQRALQSDPAYAPFVPADMDGRSETMRVVLKIQSVNVNIRRDLQTY